MVECYHCGLRRFDIITQTKSPLKRCVKIKVHRHIYPGRSSPRKNPVLHHNIVDRRKIVTKPFFPAILQPPPWCPSNHNDVSISIGWIAHYAPLLFEPLQLVFTAADLPLNVDVKADPTIVVRLVLPLLRTGVDRW